MYGVVVKAVLGLSMKALHFSLEFFSNYALTFLENNGASAHDDSGASASTIFAFVNPNLQRIVQRVEGFSPH